MRGSGGWSTVSHRWRSVSTTHLCIFVVDRVTLGQVFVRVHRFSPLSNAPPTPPLVHCHSFILFFTVLLFLLRFRDHNRATSSGRVISPTQRPLPDNTQHSQETDTHAPAGFESAITGSERIQTHALDRAATDRASSPIIDAVYNTERFIASSTL